MLNSNITLVADADRLFNCIRSLLVSLYMSDSSVRISSASRLRRNVACNESPNEISASEPRVNDPVLLNGSKSGSVSYTHLTLPPSDLV